MLGGLDDIRVVVESATDKDLVKFIWAELAVDPALCLIWVISWADVFAAVQIFVDVLDKYFFNGWTLLVLCLGCWCC